MYKVAFHFFCPSHQLCSNIVTLFCFVCLFPSVNPSVCQSTFFLICLLVYLSDILVHLSAVYLSHWKTSFEKSCFFCVGEYAEYRFDQQMLIWYVFRLWGLMCSCCYKRYPFVGAEYLYLSAGLSAWRTFCPSVCLCVSFHYFSHVVILLSIHFSVYPFICLSMAAPTDLSMPIHVKYYNVLYKHYQLFDGLHEVLFSLLYRLLLADNCNQFLVIILSSREYNTSTSLLAHFADVSATTTN